MPPTAGTRTSTRQGRATVRPTNYYARSFAGRLAAHGMEQTPEASNSAPGFFPALTHFTGAVDALPKEVIKHFSMFKEVEAKLHDPEFLLKELLDEIARQPITTNAQRRAVEENADAVAVQNANQPPPNFDSLPPEEQAVIRKRQLFLRLRMIIHNILPTLDEKLVVLQGAKATKDKGITRMTHSYSQLDTEISEEARYGSLTHWAYADKEEKKKGAPNHERQRREVAAANNLAAAAQHVHDADSIAAKSEARREAMLAKRSRQQQVDSDFDDRPAAKKPQKRKAHAPDTAADRSVGLGTTANASGQSGKRKKTEKALAAAAPTAAPMERSMSGALKASSHNARAGSSPRATPSIETGAAVKRKPRAAPTPAPRKNQLPTYSPPPVSSPLAANFAITKATTGTADRPLSSRARKNSTANSVGSGSLPEPIPIRRPSTSHSVHQAPSSNAITELEQAAGIARDNEPTRDLPTPHETTEAPASTAATVLKQEDQDRVQDEPDSMDIDTPAGMSSAARAARASKPGTPLAGSFPEPMVRSRSTRNAQNGNSNSAGSSENNSTATGVVSKRGNKKNGASNTSAMDSPALKPTPVAKSNPPSSAASSVAPEQEYQDVETDEGDGEDEPRYCYCNEVSYGQMVACDNDACPREWFHLHCVQLEKAPAGRTKWFCSDECQEQHAKSKAKGKRPGSSRQ